MSTELSLAIISSANALLVVALTQWLSHRSRRKEFRSTYLADALADLFSTYLRFCSDSGDSNRYLLLTSVERCRLYCSKRFLSDLEAFEIALLYDSPDMQAVGKLFNRLRILSRQESYR